MNLSSLNGIAIIMEQVQERSNFWDLSQDRVEVDSHCRSHLNPAGNWCGHDPKRPRFFKQPKTHGERPDAIRIAAANAEHFYYHPQQWLPSLAMAHSSTRQERSEARERDTSIVQVLLHYIELASLRVGVPCHKEGAFKNFSLQFIAEKAGFRKPGDLPEKGIKRAYRGIRQLVKAGYIQVHKRFDLYKSEEGLNKYKGLPAVKRLNQKLFAELGVSLQRLSFRRRQARKRINQRISQECKQVDQQLSGIAHSFVEKSKPFKKGLNIAGSSQNQQDKASERRFQRKKQDLARLQQLMRLYPETPPRELLQRFNLCIS